MIDFGKRSPKKEYLDRDDISFEDIRQNMKELNFINSHLGGHKITIDGLNTLASGKTKLHICEIGCGGGDNLVALSNWCAKNNIEASFTGIDINEHCIAFARSRPAAKNFNYITSDYSEVDFDISKPDIIFSSLFCHHFSEAELVTMFKWMQKKSSVGFFVNDLHRNSVAWWLIRMLTQLFSKSYLVKHDAPLSVLRGFKKSEFASLLEQAGIRNYSIKWKWAFRYLVVVPFK